MTTTGRDQIWSLALTIAVNRHERDWCREFSPETVATVADERGLETSTRTVRRVLDAMADDDGPNSPVLTALEGTKREYRLNSRHPLTNLATGRRLTQNVYSQSEIDEPSNLDDGARDGRGDGAASEPVDATTGPTEPFADELLIYHIFADTGVEAEPLSAYGRVVRVGLEPERTAYGDVLRADALEVPLAPVADLVVLHPPCQPWSPLTRIEGTQDEHPKLIAEARELGRELGEHYIIENVPEAPLLDAVELDGRAFGLPVPYRRAFETSFDVPEPPVPEQPVADVDYTEPFEYDDGERGIFLGDVEYWRGVKQVSGDYDAKPLKHAGIPAPFIHYLARHWLRARESESMNDDTTDTTAPTTKNAAAERGEQQ